MKIVILVIIVELDFEGISDLCKAIGKKKKSGATYLEKDNMWSTTSARIEY